LALPVLFEHRHCVCSGKLEVAGFEVQVEDVLVEDILNIGAEALCLALFERCGLGRGEFVVDDDLVGWVSIVSQWDHALILDYCQEVAFWYFHQRKRHS